MGSGLLWFPSRRLVSSHLGALSRILEGHWRSGRLRGGKALYFVHGSLSLGLAGIGLARSWSCGQGSRDHVHGHLEREDVVDVASGSDGGRD
jgi:hypothetical protein